MSAMLVDNMLVYNIMVVNMLGRWRISSHTVSQRTPQVDTEVVQELEKLRDHVYRLVLSLLSLFNFFNLFDMFDLFHLVDLFNFFHLFNLFNAG